MKWNASVSLIVAGTLLGAAGAAFAETPLLTLAARDATSDFYRGLDVFENVFQQVRDEYVEQPDDAALIRDAINGMVSGLDPQSSYLSPADLKAAQTRAGSASGDVGLVLTMDDGAVKVVSAIDDTPAAAAGILANDDITAIDGKDLQGATLNQTVAALRGAVGTPVTLTIARDGVANPYDVKLQRAEIPVRSVLAREDSEVGYVRISQFNNQTGDELKAAVSKIQSDLGGDKVQGYVIDLRSNPGGAFDQAVAVADDFLDGGSVVTLRGRDPTKTRQVDSRPADLAPGKPIVVLVNGGSASESEIVAGALQDHRRATIVGTRSFGSGSVQSLIPLGADGALKLTTARYDTPSGRSIQANGISPDIVVAEELPPDLIKKAPPAGDTALKGGAPNNVPGARMPTGSSSYVAADPQKDTQLNYALNLLRGVQVNAAFPADPGKGVSN